MTDSSRDTTRIPFDLGGPLPVATTLVLQASAGTGKTHTVATLAARYVAEGVARLDQLMVVTFSGASTRELRSRIRLRLSDLARFLAEVEPGSATRPVADTAPLPDAAAVPVSVPAGPGIADVDPAWQAVVDSVDPAEAYDRVMVALAGFDRATICTTHQFCDRMLAELGVLADHDRDTVLLEDIGDLTTQAVTDEYLRRYAHLGTGPFALSDAIKFCHRAVDNPELPLVPDPATGVAAERVSFASQVRQLVEDRKRQLGIYTFDDMQQRLLDALTGPQRDAATGRIRRRFPVVLVDEFQDTDPTQWAIISQTFVGHATTLLIGDPKQSIYGFRGADVQAYLEAVGQVEVRTLDTNRRTTGALVEAVSALFNGAALGDRRITVDPVISTRPRLELVTDGPWRHALRIRTNTQRTSGGFARNVDRDLAADVAQLLRSGSRFASAEGTRPLVASDVAVLVATNKRGERIQRQLAELGIPAVFTGVPSVFTSAAAQDWRKLLIAIDQPRGPAIRAAALTDLVGWTLAGLVSATADEVAGLTVQIRRWSRLYRTDGVAGLLQVIQAEGLAPRILADAGGERALTDIRHVAELLHTHQQRTGVGPLHLAEWLAEQIDEAGAGGTDDRSRRLETDDAVVRISTIHQAKGLEFPIVYLPELSQRFIRRSNDDALRVHGEHDGRPARLLDVGGQTSGRAEREQQHRQEEDAESLRVLYVALTRAQSHVTTWWAPTDKVAESALNRVLLRPEDLIDIPPSVRPDANPRDVVRLQQMDVVIEDMSADRRSPESIGPADALKVPPVQRLRHDIDTSFRRTSYSALTATAHDQFLPDFAEQLVSDEPAAPEPTEGETTRSDALPLATKSDDPALAQVSPMADLPGGVTFGSLVHAVFEYADLHAKDAEGELRRIVAEQTRRMPMPGVTTDALVTALLPALNTPLVGMAGQPTLRDIRLSDRLAELDFELPLGSDAAAGTITKIAELLEQTLPPSDLLAEYPQHLAAVAGSNDPLRGFLTGSIDATIRIGQQFHVVDYKTNRLSSGTGPLTLGNYTGARMAQAMMESHYPLQALLYLVALHRFLRWRMPDYDPDTHLGPVGYLFVRGMAGPDTPIVDGLACGVFCWQPPPGLVPQLSDLLGGRP